MSHKRTNGERVGNIQFGYQLGSDGKHVEPAPAERAVLLEIRNMRQNGHTMRDIAAELNHRALRTRRGSAWRLEHVARILKQGKAAPSLPVPFAISSLWGRVFASRGDDMATLSLKTPPGALSAPRNGFVGRLASQNIPTRNGLAGNPAQGSDVTGP